MSLNEFLDGLGKTVQTYYFLYKLFFYINYYFILISFLILKLINMV